MNLLGKVTSCGLRSGEREDVVVEVDRAGEGNALGITSLMVGSPHTAVHLLLASSSTTSASI